MIDRPIWYSPQELDAAAKRIVYGPTSDESGSEKAEFHIHRRDPKTSTANWDCQLSSTAYTYRFDSNTTRTIIHYKNAFGNQVVFCQDDDSIYRFHLDNVEIEYGPRLMFSPD